MICLYTAGCCQLYSMHEPFPSSFYSAAIYLNDLNIKFLEYSLYSMHEPFPSSFYSAAIHLNELQHCRS